MAQPGGIHAAMSRKASEVNTAASVLADTTLVDGTVRVTGSGETTMDVAFPVWFAEMPVFLNGHSLESGHSPEDGNFPVASASVIAWDIRELSEQRTYYRGATLGIVQLGKEDMVGFLHFMFHGVAFVNPTIDDIQSTDVI